MRVADLMSRKLISVAPGDSVEVVVQMLRQRGIRHLVVLKEGRLVGIISDRDIKRALDPETTKTKKMLSVGGLFFLLEPILVREIMTRNPITIEPWVHAQDAALLMVTEGFGALPVEEDGRVVGIITETDLLRYFAHTDPNADKPAPAATAPPPVSAPAPSTSRKPAPRKSRPRASSG